MKRKLHVSIGTVGFGVFLTVFSCSALAEAIGIKLSPGARIFPGLEIAVRNDDNYYSTPNMEESASYVLVKPELLLKTKSGNLFFDLGFNGEMAQVDTNSQDDYFDHDIFAALKFKPSIRHEFNIDIARSDDHDPFGIGRTEGTPRQNRSLDLYYRNLYGVEYRFGAPNAKFNLALAYDVEDKNYETNRAVTQFLDYEREQAAATIFYNFSAKTSFFLQGQHRDIEYQSVVPGVAARDGDEERILIGAKWLATAKTSGEVKVGRLEREFDDARRADFDASSWEASISWLPRKRTQIKLTSQRDTRESYLVGADTIDDRNVRLSWEQSWSKKLTSTVSLQDGQQSFEGITREDDYNRYAAGLDYAINKVAEIYGEVAYQERDSNVAVGNLHLRDFEKTVFGIGIRYNP